MSLILLAILSDVNVCEYVHYTTILKNCCVNSDFATMGLTIIWHTHLLRVKISNKNLMGGENDKRVLLSWIKKAGIVTGFRLSAHPSLF